MSLTLDVRSPVKGVWHLGLVKDETIALGSWEPSLENTPELDRRLENFLWRGTGQGDVWDRVVQI